MKQGRAASCRRASYELLRGRLGRVFRVLSRCAIASAKHRPFSFRGATEARRRVRAAGLSCSASRRAGCAMRLRFVGRKAHGSINGSALLGLPHRLRNRHVRHFAEDGFGRRVFPRRDKQGRDANPWMITASIFIAWIFAGSRSPTRLTWARASASSAASATPCTGCAFR